LIELILHYIPPAVAVAGERWRATLGSGMPFLSNIANCCGGTGLLK